VRLIYGKRDAVLVYTVLTIEHPRRLANVVEAARIDWRAISPRHGDNFFGLSSLMEAIPQAKASVRDTRNSSSMHEQYADTIENLASRFSLARLAGRCGAEPMEKNDWRWKGTKLVSVNAGRTDTAHYMLAVRRSD